MKKDAKVLIIGLGEIGYSNAEYMSQRGLSVYGYDTNEAAVKRAISNGVVEDEAADFSGFDYYVVCVSTHNPENLYEPSLEGIFRVAERLSNEGTEDALVSVESTVAMGTCKMIKQIVGHRLHVAHIPHRFYAEEKDEHGVRQMRVLGGCEECCSIEAINFYDNLLNIPFYLVSSVEIAELTKIIENSYRFLEIAFAEELRMFCEAYGFDCHELREAINSKWNMNILEARDGIGGHCLPKDTEMYLRLLSCVSNESIISSAKDVDHRYKLKHASKGRSRKPWLPEKPVLQLNEAESATSHI